MPARGVHAIELFSVLVISEAEAVSSVRAKKYRGMVQANDRQGTVSPSAPALRRIERYPAGRGARLKDA
jgi:hypothetical protein